ncbi:MAG: hypothetical protein SNH94_02230 [Rikenellaceae bacterium]
MKRDYLIPQIEVVEIAIEDAILSTSGVEDFSDGVSFGDNF